MKRQGMLQNRHTKDLHLHLIHPQDYLLCKLSGGQRLPLPVIPQIVTRQITGRLFLKRYRNMEQNPALIKLTQQCVIENTIANAI